MNKKPQKRRQRTPAGRKRRPIAAYGVPGAAADMKPLTLNIVPPDQIVLGKDGDHYLKLYFPKDYLDDQGQLILNSIVTDIAIAGGREAEDYLHDLSGEEYTAILGRTKKLRRHELRPTWRIAWERACLTVIKKYKHLIRPEVHEMFIRNPECASPALRLALGA